MAETVISRTMKSLSEFFERAQEFHILVAGDVMLDKYVYGKVDRISPEAPVPVLQFQYSDSRLGGASNVALNVRRLGAKASIMGMVGEDAAGKDMLQMFKSEDIKDELVTVSDSATTTVKTRILGGHQHLLRIDEESHREITRTEALTLSKRLSEYLDADNVDAIILQDYNKGFLSAPMIRMMLEAAHRKGIPVCVDPKDTNFFEYEGVAIFKPNLRELRARLPFAVDVTKASLQDASKYLREDIKCEMTAITLSEHGIFLSRNGESGLFPTRPQMVIDVCGAGDAVISVLTLAYLMKANLHQMADLANVAGGVVCGEVGVCPVDVAIMKQLVG